MVVLVPVPAIAPGFIVQFPAGKLFSTTLPVATEQVGCVIVPGIGAEGVAGCTLITISADAGEIQPSVFVTVKLYVPATRPDMVVLMPVPKIAPGLIVQFPAGKPFNTTLPVESEQVGCVIVPGIGADGVAGCALITIFAEAKEVHPSAFVTV